MRLFYFILKAGRQSWPDHEGVELSDEAGAHRYAIAVAKELMRNRVRETRHWRIQVCDDYLLPLFSVFFAEVGESIRTFPPGLRLSIGRVARTAAAFNDALIEARLTLNEVRMTLARADRILASIPQAPDSDRPSGVPLHSVTKDADFPSPPPSTRHRSAP